MNKLFILILLSMFYMSCLDLEKQTFKGGTWNFEGCIHLTDAVLYADFMILLENTSSRLPKYDRFKKPEDFKNTKFIVINYLTNKVDTALQQALNKNGISKLYVKNDSLFAFSFVDEIWLHWNDAWKVKTPFINEHFHNFETSYLKSKCKLIYEDETYFIYSYDEGRYGSGVVFLNKMSGQLNGYFLPVVISTVYKDTVGYIVAGNRYLRLGKILSQVLRIKNPDKLPSIPDELIIYREDSFKYKMSNLSNYLRNKVKANFSDSIKTKIQLINNKINDFNERRNPDFLKRYNWEMQIDSFYMFNAGASYLINKLGYLDDNETHCYSSFLHQNKLMHLIKDSTFHIVQLENNRFVEDSAILKQFPTGYLFSDHQLKDKKLLVIEPNKEAGACKKIICLIIDNKHIKRYNFN